MCRANSVASIDPACQALPDSADLAALRSMTMLPQHVAIRRCVRFWV